MIAEGWGNTGPSAARGENPSRFGHWWVALGAAAADVADVVVAAAAAGVAGAAADVAAMMAARLGSGAEGWATCRRGCG